MPGGNQGPPGSVPGKPYAVGDGRPRPGGKKGRSGRPTNDVRRACAKDLADPAVRNAGRAILRNPNHPHHASILKLWMAYAYGPPERTVNVNHGVNGVMQSPVPLDIQTWRDLARAHQARAVEGEGNGNGNGNGRH